MIYYKNRNTGGANVLNLNFKTDDGLHTVRLEGTVGKYAVWADDDFVKYAYLTSNCWILDGFHM